LVVYTWEGVGGGGGWIYRRKAFEIDVELFWLRAFIPFHFHGRGKTR
jgi:hypothetical protein